MVCSRSSMPPHDETAADDQVVIAQQVHHLRDHGRIVVEVRVHDDQRLPCAASSPSRDGVGQPPCSACGRRGATSRSAAGLQRCRRSPAGRRRRTTSAVPSGLLSSTTSTSGVAGRLQLSVDDVDQVAEILSRSLKVGRMTDTVNLFCCVTTGHSTRQAPESRNPSPVCQRGSCHRCSRSARWSAPARLGRLRPVRLRCRLTGAARAEPGRQRVERVARAGCRSLFAQRQDQARRDPAGRAARPGSRPSSKRVGAAGALGLAG